jgi:UDP-glucose 4-epimerase
MSRCVVIGANGFIGSHIVDALALAGHEVTAFDRFSSGAISYAATQVRQVTGDFLSHSDLREAIRNQQYVFHFLSTTNPAIADREATLDIRTNVSQSVDLFQMCADNGVEKLFFASTGGAIYGDQGTALHRETDPTLPMSPYGIGKLTLENYLRYFKKKFGLESVSLRISNPYGPRQHPNRKQGLIPIALLQVARNEPVVRFGSGAMIRDFVYVEDVARMVTAMVGRPTNDQTYNIGSGIGHSVSEVLSLISAVTGRDFEVREEPIPPTFVETVVLDTTRFKAEFGVDLLTELESGIDRTWHNIVSHGGR